MAVASREQQDQPKFLVLALVSFVTGTLLKCAHAPFSLVLILTQQFIIYLVASHHYKLIYYNNII
jgi:hypothetical protein